MKVLHVPFHYFPDPVGGTEIYTSALARALQRMGIGSEIAAPGLPSGEYVHDGIHVHRFAFTQTPSDVSMLYGRGDMEATRRFAGILDAVQPDIVHLHAMSPAVSLDVLREIKKREVPAVFTCHIPGITCARGTMLHQGSEVCDGIWSVARCSSCVLQAKGVPRFVAGPLGTLPTSVGRGVAALKQQGRAATALRMTELQALRQRCLREFLSEVDHIVTMSEWLRSVMVANGIRAEKVSLIRHGSTQERHAAEPGVPRGDGRLRVAFVGRLTPAKGVHVVLQALRRHPELRATLDVFGIVQDDHDYAAELAAQVRLDFRIRFRAPLANVDVVPTLRQYDVLAVPSQGMETGPLVVYDAFEAGIPVVGSRRGGIAELVDHEVNGLLVEPGDPNAWAGAFARLHSESGFLAGLTSQARPGRTMDAVALEMIDVYASCAS